MEILKLRPAGPEYKVQNENGTTVTLRELSYRKMVGMIIDTAPLNAQGQTLGFGPDTMRERLRLTKAVEAMDEKHAKLKEKDPAAAKAIEEDGLPLELEDADAKALAAASLHARWFHTSEWMVDFVDALKALGE